MTVGTKSLLFGAHQIILHPIFVAIAWVRLYGWPKDWRLWVAFIVHDWGYWGKPNMNGTDGEKHPVTGAGLMRYLFTPKVMSIYPARGLGSLPNPLPCPDDWWSFMMFHSRFLARKWGFQPSRLCWADKLSFLLYPKWLYLLLSSWSGEIDEYKNGSWRPAYSNDIKPDPDPKVWYENARKRHIEILREGANYDFNTKAYIQPK